MTFTLFVTGDDRQHWKAPYLIASDAAMPLPPHPEGKAWCWALSSSEAPRDALIGTMLVRILKRRGWVISELPLEQLLRFRLVAPTLSPRRPARSRRSRKR